MHVAAEDCLSDKIHSTSISAISQGVLYMGPTKAHSVTLLPLHLFKKEMCFLFRFLGNV